MRSAANGPAVRRPTRESGVTPGDCDLGRGVFATRHFRVGELILVFRGVRFDRDDPIHYTAAGANLLQTGPRSYILPDPPGLFVNHSCNPNAGIAGKRRLVATRDIWPMEEIRFDYSTTMAEDLWTMECRCGEPNCRSTIGDFKYLPWVLQARYSSLGIVPRFISRKMDPSK